MAGFNPAKGSGASSLCLLVLDTRQSQFSVVQFTRSSGLIRHRGEVSCFAECGVASPRKFRQCGDCRWQIVS